MPPTLTAHTAWNADFRRHPRRESAAEPQHAPPTLAAHTAWNADFRRHPRRESAAEPHHATHPYSPHGLERRLQPAPAAREGRGTAPCHSPLQPTRLGTPTSVGTRGARAPRNCTMPLTLTAHTAWNAGFSRHPRPERAAELHHATHPRSPHGLERRLQSAPAARERRGTAPCHPPSQPTRPGTPTSVGTPRRESAAEPHHATHPHSPHGLERRLQSAPAARERRGTTPCHPPSQPTRPGTPTSRATRNECRLAPSSIPRAQGVSAELSLCADFSRHPRRESAAELTASLSCTAATPWNPAS